MSLQLQLSIFHSYLILLSDLDISENGMYLNYGNIAEFEDWVKLFSPYEYKQPG